MSFRFQPRALTPQQEMSVRFLAGAGVPPGDLATMYGVHRRTIYRTIRRAAAPFVVVEIAGYHATFELDDLGPIQVTEWRAA